VADYPFKRVRETAAAPATIALGEEELKKFAGRYESKSPPVELSVEVVGGRLKAFVPARPVYALLPVAANRFGVEGAPAGFFVQFETAEGRPQSLNPRARLMGQPGPVPEAVRSRGSRNSRRHQI
jgi:hypothetical protein